MYCKNCGQFLSGKENFCSNCGNKIVIEEETIEKEFEKPDENIGFIKRNKDENDGKISDKKGIALPEMNWNTEEFNRCKKNEEMTVSWRNDDMFLQKELREADEESVIDGTEQNEEKVQGFVSVNDKNKSEDEIHSQGTKATDKNIKSNLEIPKVFEDTKAEENKPDFLKDDNVVEVEQPGSSLAIEVNDGEEIIISDGKERIVAEREVAACGDESHMKVAKTVDAISDFSADESEGTSESKVAVKSLFDEIAQDAANSLENAQIDQDKKRIDKFYTFNRKKEEFQKLLDKEYERIEKNVEAGGFEEDIAKFMDVELGTDVDATTQLEEMVRARELFFDTPAKHGVGTDNLPAAKPESSVSNSGEIKGKDETARIEMESDGEKPLNTPCDKPDGKDEDDFERKNIVPEGLEEDGISREIVEGKAETIDIEAEKCSDVKRGDSIEFTREHGEETNETNVSEETMEKSVDTPGYDTKTEVFTIENIEQDIQNEVEEDGDLSFLKDDDEEISVTEVDSDESRTKTEDNNDKGYEDEKAPKTDVKSEVKSESANENIVKSNNEKDGNVAQVIIDPEKEKEKQKEREKVAEKFFEDAADDRHRMGRKSKIALWILAMITLLILILFAVRVFLPSSYVAKQIDTASSKIAAVFKGNSNAKNDEKKDDLAIDKTELIKANSDKNINKSLEKVAFNGDLKYSDSDKDAFENISKSKITSGLTWKDNDGESISYDKAVVGRIMEFESAKNAYIDGKKSNVSVLDMIEKDSDLYKEVEALKGGKEKTKVKKLEIGDIRKAGDDFFVWVNEINDNTSVKKIYKLSLKDDNFVFTGVSKVE